MTSETSAPTFKEATKRYRTEAGEEYQQPDKTLSTHQRGAWLLNGLQRLCIP